MTRRFWTFVTVLVLLPPASAQQWDSVAAEVTGSATAFSGNTHSWADIDGDGDLDIYVDSHVIWLNEMNTLGTFTLRNDLLPTTSGGVWSAAFGDFNNDGKPDLHLAKGVSGFNAIIENQWPAPFVDVSTDLNYIDSEFCQPAYWADYNNDGLLDLYVTHEYPDEAHEFWQNMFPTEFVPRFPEPGGEDAFGLADLNSHAYGLSWGDIDIDGDIDVVTSACGSGDAIPNEDPHNKVYENMVINVGGPTADRFLDRSLSVGLVDSNEIANGSEDYWATLFDYDNDGFLDLCIGDNGGNHRLWHNTGQNPGDFGFELVPAAVHGLTGGGAFGRAGVAGDYDNDGLLDLYLTTNGLYRNTGGGSFALTNHAPPPSSFRDASLVDYDMDGDLDILTQDRLYRNPGNENHWLAIELDGSPDHKVTRSAHHTKIRVTAGELVQTREHRYQVAAYSQHMMPTHFGLGSAEIVDEVVVFWADGSQTVLTDVPVDQYINIGQRAECGGALSAATATSLVGCVGSSFNLAVNTSNGAPLRWRVVSGPSNSIEQFDDPTADAVSFTPLRNGSYVLAAGYEGCPTNEVRFIISDTDYDGDGDYDNDDLVAGAPAWADDNAEAIYDVDGDGIITILDSLHYCHYQP